MLVRKFNVVRERIIEMEFSYQNVSRIHHNEREKGKFAISVNSYKGWNKTNNVN